MTASGTAGITRRQALLGGSALALTPKIDLALAAEEVSLHARAAKKGLLFGASFATHELDTPYGEKYADIYARDCAVLTSELELKMLILRPDAATIDFKSADRFFEFAAKHSKAVRGHTLIWNDNLPEWVKRLGPGEVEHLLEAHIGTVIERYNEKVRSWDVVNEPIAPWDKLPGNLRGGAFYAAMGEDYIVRAFREARRAASKAELVLNEAQTESDDENGEVFRTSLFDLIKRLKDKGAAIDTIGLQCHIDTRRPYDFAKFADYVQSIAALGHSIAITELDVNDRALSGNTRQRDAQVADIYSRFLKAILPISAVKTLTLWQIADRTSWMFYEDEKLPERMRRYPRPLLYDEMFKPKPSWFAVAEALDAMPAR